MIRALLWAACAAGCMWAGAAAAQPATPGVTLAHTERRVLVAEPGGQRYELLVSLPHDYATSTKRYPVLYVLDGWHFPLMAFLQDNSRFSKRMPAAIIVTINHGSTDEMRLRARDFTPNSATNLPASGGAAAFLAFIERQLVPMVDGAYRTDPADRALLGHSLGGTFALYAMQERPRLFQRIVAASPSLGWEGQKYFAPSRLKDFEVPVRLDVSMGSQEPNPGNDGAWVAGWLGEQKPKGLAYRFTTYDGENHNSVRLVAFPSGLAWVYAQP